MVEAAKPDERNWVSHARSARLLVVESDQRHLRSLTRTLKSIVGHVVGRPALVEPFDVDEFDLLVVDYDTLEPDARRSLLRQFGVHRAKTRLLFLSGGKCKDDFVDLFAGHALTNLVAKANDEVDPDELIVTIRKILTRDIFGLEKYFIWGVEPVRIAVTELVVTTAL